MSAYGNDDRVTARTGSGNLLDVDDREGRSGMVWLQGDGRWVASREHGSYARHDTADEAIRSLIGDPQ